MRFKKICVGVSCMGVILLLGSGLTACGKSTADTPSASPSPSTSASTSSREDAERYFAAMAPVIEKDYQGDKQSGELEAQWSAKYGNADPMEWAPWEAMAEILQKMMPLGQEVLGGYEAIEPPAAFAQAHATLLEGNRKGVEWAQSVIDNVASKKPLEEWVQAAMDEVDAGLALEAQFVDEITKAATEAGIEVPAKLLETYSVEQ